MEESARDGADAERRAAALAGLRRLLAELDALGHGVPAIHLCYAIELLERE